MMNISIVARIGFFACLLTGTGAHADEAPLARVVSVESARPQGASVVTLQLERGVLNHGSEIEMLTPTGKARGTVKLPDNFPAMKNRMRMQRVTLLLGQPVPSAAWVSTPGRFADYAAAEAAFKGGAAGTTTMPAAVACPFSAAELGAALGTAMMEGKGSETPFAGGRYLSCAWHAAGNGPSVHLNQTIVAPGGEAGLKEYEKRLAGRLLPVNGDPDGARWQGDQGDLSAIALIYSRPQALTELRLLGTDLANKARTDALRARVLALRRVP